MTPISRLLLAICLASGATAAAAAKPKLAVLPLAANRVPTATAGILNDLLTAALDAGRRYEVLSVSDLNAMLGFEKLKDVAGCSDAICGAEIGGALGVELLLSGSVSVLGDELIVQLALIDTRIPQVVGRGRAVVPNDETLYRRAVEAAAAQVSGAEPAESGAPSTPTRATGPRSPASFAFETRDTDYAFTVAVTTQQGEVHACETAVRVAQPCALKELGLGPARLSVTSGMLKPFLDNFTVRNEAELYAIQIESMPGDGSVIAWALGGVAAAAGVALLGVGAGVNTPELVYAGIPTALVGAGVVTLGFFFERRIVVNYPGIDALF